MGDRRRFDLFAKLIARNMPRDSRIADVASGGGALQAALHQLGYRHVTSWDKRKRNAKNRTGYRYGYFDYRNAPRDYDAVVAMHPDEATDHVILYAAKHRIPAIVCPCCVKPSACTYWGAKNEQEWTGHLRALATRGRLSVTEAMLPMAGRNRVLIMRPEERA